MSVTPIKDTFSAWIDRMPGVGTRPKLIVVGEVECPGEGWAVDLQRAESPGLNPTIILLDLIATPLEGKEESKSGDTVTRLKVRYEESPPKADYTKAQIQYGSDSFTIDVGRTD